MSSFRKQFNTYTQNEIRDNEFGFTQNESFVPEDEVKSMLDSIESGMNIIKEGLENIKGLTEIDDIFNIVKVLSDKLY